MPRFVFPKKLGAAEIVAVLEKELKTALNVAFEPPSITDQFAADWNRMHATAIGANPFSRIEWIQTGWDLFGRPDDSLVPIRFIDDRGDTKAMTLFSEGTRRRFGRNRKIWRTIDFNAQRTTPILAPDIETWTSVVESLFDLPQRPFWSLELYKLDSLGGELSRAVGQLCRNGISADLQQYNRQPRIRMGEDWTEYRHSRSKTFWKARRKSSNQIVSRVGTIEYRRLRSPEDFSEGRLQVALKDVRTVFESSWQYKELSESADSTWQFHERIIRQFASEGLADLNLLYVCGKPVAFDWNLRQDESVYLIFGCYDQSYFDYSVGTVLMTELIQNGHTRGDRVIEFGGEYLEYKKMWGNEEENAYALKLQKANILTASYQFAKKVKRSIR
jgi:Acetyltransferase (GNAT) domain